MKVLVSDTSVLIDLERGEFLEAIFRLPLSFVVPDLLYERELKDYTGPDLIRYGLHVQELDSVGLTLAIDYYRKHKKVLSLPDVFAFVLAKTNSWVLLTGDSALRGLATEDKVICHGVLWLLDHLYDCCVTDQARLYKGLLKIAEHPRCRLPQVEIRKRLKLYSA